MLKKFIRTNKIFNLFEPYLPGNTSNKISAEYYPLKLLSDIIAPVNVLDLGCGAGNSIDLFKKINSNVCWHGIDVEKSPELKTRTRNDGDIRIYDGINLPYEEGFFYFIYTQQVFEHVRYPDKLLQSIYRVLKPGGYFAGSVSYLEPYHSYSLFNFTPYGLITLLQDAGFKTLEIRPAIDCFSLIFRQMLNASRFFNFFFKKNSPVDLFINLLSMLFGLGHKERNFLKVQFAGQICFLVKKT